ncbi:alpha/beta hydrolase-fold protein [Hoylesella oralis]|uniref:alpha/beta hydrolase-fold protein n=1 Tax=Hoylesella oralis TaxID=28134 RepID=UPI0028F0987D|nr:alpha/beta hydrolase-fold protein [Hoylesella oralis]
MRRFVFMVLAGLLGMHAFAENNSTLPQHVNSVTAIHQVFGDGAKVKTIVIDYDAPVSNRNLKPTTFDVAGKKILRVYANTKGEADTKGRDGHFVIIELQAATDLNAQPRRQTPADEQKKKERDKMMGGPGLRAGWSTGGDDMYVDSLVITQKAPIRTVGGKVYEASGISFSSTVNRYLVADDFQQQSFRSPYTGQTLPYNLYLPKNYDSKKNYPLVLFIHDAGVASSPVKTPLIQGRGAVTWAEPQWQAEHPCIVVAPEYPYVTVDDNWNYSHHLDATVALLKELMQKYAVNEHRIYVTGQSMGCMSSMVLMLKEPRLFAGALLVAGKWEPDVLAPLAEQNLWIISCEGDASSTKLQNKAVNFWRSNGATVSEATWDMKAAPADLSAEAKAMVSPAVHLYYTHLTGGSHRATWFVAYDIDGVKEWLFSQKRK